MRTRHKCPECGEICVTDTYHPGIKIVCHSCGEEFEPSKLNIVGPGLGIEEPIEKVVRDALHKTLLEESDKILQEWKDGNCNLERAYNEMHKLWGDEDEPP